MLLFANDRTAPIAFATVLAIGSKRLLRVTAKPAARSTCSIRRTSESPRRCCSFPSVGIAPPYQFTENFAGAWHWLVPAIIVVTGSFINARFSGRVPLIAAWLGGFSDKAPCASPSALRRSQPSYDDGRGFRAVHHVHDHRPGDDAVERRAQIVFGLATAAVYGLLVAAHVAFGLFFALIMVCGCAACPARDGARARRAAGRAALPSRTRLRDGGPRERVRARRRGMLASRRAFAGGAVDERSRAARRISRVPPHRLDLRAYAEAGEPDGVDRVPRRGTGNRICLPARAVPHSGVDVPPGGPRSLARARRRRAGRARRRAAHRRAAARADRRHRREHAHGRDVPCERAASPLAVRAARRRRRAARPPGSDDGPDVLLAAIEEKFKAPFEPVADEGLAGCLSNTIAGRICNYFDFGGGGYVVDGACASSLVAVANACAALEAGDVDAVVAGAVDVSLDPFELIGFSRLGALATDDDVRLRARRDGFLPGEGAAFVIVLLREATARARSRLRGSR